jgi:hypothetical protein
MMDADDEVPRAQFRSATTRLVSEAPRGVIRGSCLVELARSEALWTRAGIKLKPGDWVTTLAVGRTQLSSTLDIRAGAHIQLRMRVGIDGTVIRGTRNTHSFLAFESGPLYLARSLSSELADQPAAPAARLDACHLSIAVLLWNGPTLSGLKRIAGLGVLEELIDAEIDRIRNDEPPEGQYQRLLGRTRI